MRPVCAILTPFLFGAAARPWLLTTVGGTTVVVALAIGLSPASASVRHEQDVFHVGDARITVERFEPSIEGRYPAVVLLHGIDGLWRMGDAYRASASRLARQGFVVLLPHYYDRTGTRPEEVPALIDRFKRYLNEADNPSDNWQTVQEPFDAWLEVVHGGVGYAQRRDNVAGDRVGLVGVSLGGYLALTAGTDGALPVGAIVDHFGGMPRCVRTAMKTMPPTLLLHGDRDQTVPLREALAVRDALAALHLPYEFKVYEGIGHVFMDENGAITWAGAQALFDAETRTAAFLRAHLSSDIAPAGR